ncbi:hypothetical protein SAMN04489761_3559 [Tenacibaculum sp. MAR_2009_124]|uniref:hypothetical protein n=1 Tax=Tenacibaculum sp. MAR_2009_124 TaxID=1250059 RepID=UPI0008983071|nr:hypothetical protein [Tenacibaculum sp. MAR_2009_124]SEC78080.1 hypothetical protein SAMN04489761_3559 [Tenacibaculum sp. MAR_2009_124]
MRRITIILSILLFCCNIYSQQSDNLSEKFNYLINYIPSNLGNKEFFSELEKKYKTRLNNVNIITTISLSAKKIQLIESEFLMLDKHAEELATELYNDGIYFLLKGYMSHGCVPFSSEIVNGKKIDLLIWCYGGMTNDGKVILRFFDKFNRKMKELI